MSRAEHELSVLLVEDDTDARDALSLILASEGYEVEAASDAEAAIAIAETFRPHVLICDWVLPGTDGVEVARVIQRSSDIPVIFVTAHSLAALRGRASDVRVLAYLPKPIDLERLRAVLRTIRLARGG